MFCEKKRSCFRWKVFLCFVALLVVVWGYDDCPELFRHSSEARAPSIPEYDIEQAFYWAQEKKKTRNSGRVFPKGLKTAETTHPQASQKPEIPKMEEKQLLFDEASKYLASSYDFTPTRVTCGLPLVYPTGEIAGKALKACLSKEETVCNGTEMYRTANGSCNNWENPTWGSAFSHVARLLVPSNTGPDGLRKSVGCEELPNPRLLSAVVHNSTGKRTSKVNNLYVYFGQFVSHDMVFTAQTTTANNEAIQCCPPRQDDHPQCAPIDASHLQMHPPQYNVVNMTCINFVRSATYPSCALGHRTQINTATAFLDGSQIYGNSLHEMNTLRALDNTGKLLVQNSRFGPLLPPSSDPSNDRCSYPEKNQICFRAGDNRVNQNPMVTSMYTVWVREHNRIATHLKKINRYWDGEKIFQESRRIVIAELQAIILNEYLQLTLGREAMTTYGLFSELNTEYKKDVDPHILTEFSTAAFRFAHSMIDGTLAEIPKRQGHGGHPVRDKYFEPFGLHEGELDLLMMGAVSTHAQALDRSLVTDVTNFLYRTRGQTTGLDLAAMNIQRGRDHALPSYADCYNLCNPSHPIESFYDLEAQHAMDVETIRVLRESYRDVRNIDLWTGIISETSVHDGILGPTGSCIVGLQFYILVYGDRYWFTHTEEAGSFTEAQRSNLKWFTSLAAVICANTNITEIPRKAMELPSSSNPMTPCRDVSGINIDYWKNC